MSVVFIADTHLKGIADPNQKTLCDFLDFLLKDSPPKLLVILGDLFDFWAGYDKVLAREYGPTLERFERLASAGTKIIYLEGNHDFLMGPYFTDRLGAEVYADTHILTINGKQIFLTHGDMLDTSLRYKLWRCFLRSFLFKVIRALVPAHCAWNIAMKLSSKSRLYTNKKLNMDMAFRDFAFKKIEQGLGAVVMGHTHAKANDIVSAGGKTGIYANPGSFAGEKTYLIYENGRFSLEKFSQ